MEIIVIQSSYTASGGKKSKKKAKCLGASALGLGTESDEEEEALIEEAEKSRQKGGQVPTQDTVEDILASLSAHKQQTPAEGATKKGMIGPNASRINLTLVRGQCSGNVDMYMTTKILAPSDNMVINSCRVRISPQPALMPHKAPQIASGE